MEPLVAYCPTEGADPAEVRQAVRLLNEHVIAIEAKLLALELAQAARASEAARGWQPKDRE